jgi:hypothetical protein
MRRQGKEKEGTNPTQNELNYRKDVADLKYTRAKGLERNSEE